MERDEDNILMDLTNDELDSNFMNALGEPSSRDKQYGDNIHEEIGRTIKNILLEGLTKAKKEELLESFLIPNNCKLLDAPKLNLEMVGLLSAVSKNRDKLLLDRQQELGIGIAGICQVIHYMSKDDYDKFVIIKKLSDVSRILSNLHFQYTETRRKLINPTLDKSLVESLKGNKREEFLYSDLDASVKAFSALKRTANVFKPKLNTQARPFQPKNFQQPVRRWNPNLGPPAKGSVRGGVQKRNLPRQPRQVQDFRQTGPIRGRARYP